VRHGSQTPVPKCLGFSGDQGQLVSLYHLRGSQTE
jgi:hypothetical protein